MISCIYKSLMCLKCILPTIVQNFFHIYNLFYWKKMPVVHTYSVQLLMYEMHVSSELCKNVYITQARLRFYWIAACHIICLKFDQFIFPHIF